MKLFDSPFPTPIELQNINITVTYMAILDGVFFILFVLTTIHSDLT